MLDAGGRHWKWLEKVHKKKMVYNTKQLLPSLKMWSILCISLELKKKKRTNNNSLALLGLESSLSFLV